ncbi:MAG: hypothetical protein QOJ40_2297 [Verrucomicrobiota bacterium]
MWEGRKAKPNRIMLDRIIGKASNHEWTQRGKPQPKLNKLQKLNELRGAKGA